MALKEQSSGNEERTYIDIVVANAQDCPTEVKPYFEDKENGVKTSNIKGKIISARGSMTPGSRGVKSITVVVVDEDGDELHINGSITMGTKDLFNQALANIGIKGSLGIYLNKKGYPTGSVRDESDEFVKDTVFPFNEVTVEGLWEYVEDELGYYNTAEKVFVKAKNAPETQEQERVATTEDEEVNIEDLPF